MLKWTVRRQEPVQGKYQKMFLLHYDENQLKGFCVLLTREKQDINVTGLDFLVEFDLSMLIHGLV